MRRVLIFVALIVGGCASEPIAPASALRALAENANHAALSATRVLNWKRSAAAWREALVAYQAIDDWEGQGRARLGLASSYARLGQTREAENILLPMPKQAMFPQMQRVQASYQLALLAVGTNNMLAARQLEDARSLCGERCPYLPALDNLQARLRAALLDWQSVEQLTTRVLAGKDVSPAERSHAFRLLAEARFSGGDIDGARAHLEQALALDRELAEPAWLLDDYRLLEHIALARGDVKMQTEVATRLASLCRGAKLVGCLEGKQTKP